MWWIVGGLFLYLMNEQSSFVHVSRPSPDLSKPKSPTQFPSEWFPGSQPSTANGASTADVMGKILGSTQVLLNYWNPPKQS